MDEKFSIQPYLTDVEMLRLTAEQIQKDLAFFSLPVSFSGSQENAYDELFGQVHPHVKKLMETDFEKFLSLLYRVDIHEKQLRGADAEQITELIIKRCLQKVVLRKLFS